ncbi:MAG: Bifunctional protein GlmU [Deltaproteobacteria bacterium ADurb.Bin510]|nr:MAG: Bifunctional protein GlmU [Deltaproteobacteria bacterium ADurb.Bin510]
MVRRDFLFEAVRNIKPNNKKGEYYLTDILAMAETVVASPTLEACEANGINSQLQLAEAAALMQRRINLAHLEAGVCIHDPLNAYIGPQVSFGPDVTVWPGAQAYGRCIIGAGATLGPDCRLRDKDVAAGQVCG